MTARQICKMADLHFETFQKLLQAGVIPPDPKQRGTRRTFTEAALQAARICAAVCRIGGNSADAIGLLRFIAGLPPDERAAVVLVKSRVGLLTFDDVRQGRRTGGARIDWVANEAQLPALVPGAPQPEIFPLRALIEIPS